MSTSDEFSSGARYLNALNKLSQIGPKRMKMLLSYFETPENAWKAGYEDLRKSGLGEKTAERIIVERNSINPGEEWEKLEKEEIKMIDIENPDYPRLLRQIPSAPYIIYIKGDLDLNTPPMIAIVGSRKYTSYGAQTAREFAKSLAGAGIVVVSGMALGIDTFAHRGALEGRGKTVAVLGNSLDDINIYPRNNFSLSREISQNGLLLSEYPPNTPAGPLTFPARNRLVAGITLGTIVVEAGEKSGALLTAQMALDYNRDVFSVPGSIFSASSIGTNNLIKKGARMVTGIKDVLDELDLNWGRKNMPSKTLPIPETKEEKTLLEILSADPLHIDNIRKLTTLNTSTVSSTLAMMEIKGWVRNIGGQNYIIL